MFSIIYWNAWKCRSLQVFHEWFRTWVKMNGLPDVICLSEVMAMLGTNESPYFAASTEGRPPVDLNGLQTLVTLLPEYTYFYQSRDVREHKMEDGSTKTSSWGSAIFYRENLFKVESESVKLRVKGFPGDSPIMQWIVFERKGETILIAHLHGLWIKGNTKGDHLWRDEQSRLAISMLKRATQRSRATKIIFGGDLNLALDTTALRYLERLHKPIHLSQNLIRKYRIASTRTKWYREYNKEGAVLYADYVLASEHVQVCSFEVIADVLASDHAILALQYY